MIYYQINFLKNLWFNIPRYYDIFQITKYIETDV